MNNDYSISANFKQQYTLNMNKAGNGTVSPQTGSHFYDGGQIVNLAAVPANGWVFDGWTGDIASIANPGSPITTITMNGNYNVTANFIRHFTLTMNKTGNGAL